MIKKLRRPQGTTFIEMLATVGVLVIMAACLGVVIPSTFSTFREVTTSAEAGVLASALTTSISDELRWATDIKTDQNNQLRTYTSSTCGAGAQLVSDGGRIRTVAANNKAYSLLSEKAYTSNLKAEAVILYEGGVFDVTLTVNDSQNQPRFTTGFSVVPVNE